jgi:hypothetical protein
MQLLTEKHQQLLALKAQMTVLKADIVELANKHWR